MSLLEVDEALRRVLARVSPLDAETVDLTASVGRVAAHPLVAARPLPAWDNSAMDGYAVRAADVPQTPITLPVVDAVAAGDRGDRPIPEGATARIFTGAPLPPGTDTVILQEDAERQGDRVCFQETPRLGQHVRRQGSDTRLGDVIWSPGRVLSPGDIAAAASQGVSAVAVHRRPVVSILSSGDELIGVSDGPPRRGQIVNGNCPALAAAVREIGGIPQVLPTVGDDAAATHAALEVGAAGDVLITTGGVSVGDHDHMGPALKTLSGDSLAFWKVAIKPGKPLAFGFIDGCATFALPGNPVSALVTFEIFVRPALLALMGHTRVCRRPIEAICNSPLPAGRRRREYLRARRGYIEGVLHVTPARTQSSGALSSIAGADALIIVPPYAPARAAGERVWILPLGPDDPSTRTGVS